MLFLYVKIKIYHVWHGICIIDGTFLWKSINTTRPSASLSGGLFSALCGLVF